jgi:hypothetical protein
MAKRAEHRGYIAEFREESGKWRWVFINADHPVHGQDIRIPALTAADFGLDGGIPTSPGSGHDENEFASAEEAVADFRACVDELLLFEVEGLEAPHTGELSVRLTPELHYEIACRASEEDLSTGDFVALLIRRHLDHKDNYYEDRERARLARHRDQVHIATATGKPQPEWWEEAPMHPEDREDRFATLSQEVSWLASNGRLDEAIRLFRKERRASWSNLQKAAYALLEPPVDHDDFSTPNVEASSKSHIRTLKKWTGLPLPELSKRIDELMPS